MAKKTAKRNASKRPVSKGKAKAKPLRNGATPSTKPKVSNTSAGRTKKAKESPKLLAGATCNTRQLKFAQEYALSGNATAAAINAGYSPSTASATASRLLKNQKVEKEIQALQQNAQDEFEVTRKDLYEMYMNAFKMAALSEAPAAMVSATTGVAKLFGLDKPIRAEEEFDLIVETGVPEADDYEAEN